MRCAGILVAGGESRRFGDEPKQLRALGGQAVLIRAAWALHRAEAIDTLVVVVPQELLERGRALLDDHGLASALLCAGGPRRVDSVAAGLAALPEAIDLVAIHDAARPLVPSSLVDRVIAAAETHGAAIPAIAVSDTVKRRSDTRAHARDARIVTETLDRDLLVLAQTPQVFHRSLIEEALASWRRRGEPPVTDDAKLVEDLGHDVLIVDGDPRNLKITTPADLDHAERILQEASPGSTSRELPRSGIGFDAHRLVPDRPLILGGVSLPSARGLMGHSDADVLTHAIIDALLGAAALGDIGAHFPPTDTRWEGADSLALLGDVVTRVEAQGLRPINIDSVIICEEPKIAPHIPKMRENLAAALGLDLTRVSVKATTTEGMGFAGRGEGIAAQATVLLI